MRIAGEPVVGESVGVADGDGVVGSSVGSSVGVNVGKGEGKVEG
jgi:hypothetical protein